MATTGTINPHRYVKNIATGLAATAAALAITIGGVTYRLRGDGTPPPIGGLETVVAQSPTSPASPTATYTARPTATNTAVPPTATPTPLIVNGFPVISEIPEGQEGLYTLPADPSMVEALTIDRYFAISNIPNTFLGLKISDGKVFSPVDGMFNRISPIHDGPYGSNFTMYVMDTITKDQIFYVMANNPDIRNTGEIHRGDLLAIVDGTLDRGSTAGLTVLIGRMTGDGRAYIDMDWSTFVNGTPAGYSR